jgi:hypothetical protein
MSQSSRQRFLGRHGRHITLALAADGALPTEFRLFTKGLNTTEKGDVIFDSIAAKSVMAAYRKWGVDLSIDLEHGMLEVEPGAPDPTARDARGWCKLELRPDGSLWAVDVRWTPDGARRLTEKTQRYISPTFLPDPKTNRVVKMFNIALTSAPATHDTPALVAASATGDHRMKYEHVKAALAAMQEGDHEKAMGILSEMVTDAASEDGSKPEDKSGAEGDGAEGVPEEKKEAVIDPKVVASSADDADEKEEEDPAKKPERKAMRAMLRSLTSSKTFGEALSKVEAFRTSHLTLETERTKLAAERAVLESAERRQLVGDLVKIGAEFPSTVWADDKATTIKPRWAAMPIVALRAHVADQKTARGATKTAPAKGVQPAVVQGAAPELVQLSAEELAVCKSMDCDPATFAALKAFRDGKKA